MFKREGQEQELEQEGNRTFLVLLRLTLPGEATPRSSSPSSVGMLKPDGGTMFSPRKKERRERERGRRGEGGSCIVMRDT